MTTQALNQLYHQAIAMLDQALGVIHELQTLETHDNGRLTDEEKKKRRRLKAFRWSIMLGVSYGGYTLVRKWLRKRREYKNNYGRMGKSGVIMGRQNYDNNHYYQNQPYSNRERGIYSNSMYGGLDNYSQGYHGNTYDYRGYQPSHSHGQSYKSYY